MAEKYTIDEVRKIRNSYCRTSPSVCREIFWDDIDKIASTIDEFAGLMQDEMFDKATEGYQGWDDIEENKAHIKKELTAHIKKGNFVGAANFCMMLHGSVRKGDST